MVTMGGGVDFLVWRGIGVGVDVRYQHVFEEDRFGRADIDRNLSVTTPRVICELQILILTRS